MIKKLFTDLKGENNFLITKWCKMDFIKAIVQLGFSVFVAWYLLTTIKPAFENFENQLVNFNTGLEKLIVLSEERQNFNIRLENKLDKIYELQLKNSK